MADDAQWLMRYYQDPKPDEVAAHLADWQKQGILAKADSQPALLGFLSRVMKENPDKVVGWLETAESFPTGDRLVVLTAAWYGDTPQAQGYFKSKELGAFAGKTPPDTAALNVDSPSILDFYWGAYAATGDPLALRRIISALEFSKDAGALDKYKSSQQTEADKLAAYHDSIYQAAMWSLTSNCRQDAKAFAICKELLAPGKLSSAERTFLAVALSKANPDQVKVEVKDGKMKVEISK